MRIDQIPNRSAEEAARAVAAWLAPYIAAELGLADPSTRPPATMRSSEDTSAEIESRYDDSTAAVFVETLGDTVLENARVFFHWLAADGKVGSLQLASGLGVGSPRNIPSILTTPLKRRAKSLELPYPWLEAADDTNRTVWIATGPVPQRLEIAANAEIERKDR